jgi:hypothetical protein
MVRTWWQKWINRGALASRLGRRRPPQPSRAGFCPQLERLEDREVLATVIWNNPAGGLWEVPGNWDVEGTSPVEHRIPGVGDDVVIRDFSPDITITHATDFHTIRRLTSAEAVVLSGGSLTIEATGDMPSQIDREFRISGFGRLALNSTTLMGLGPLTNSTNFATLTLTNSTVRTELVNRGTLVAQAASAIEGPLNMVAGSDLVVRGGNAGNAVLTVANGFKNGGTIELTSEQDSGDASLIVVRDTLTNERGATVRASIGTQGLRTLSAQLDNQGALSVNQDLALINTGRSFSNSGTITIANGRTLTVNGGLFTNLKAGTLTDGTYNVFGTFKFPDAAITTNAATIVLDGPNAQIVNQSNVNALANLAANAPASRLTLRNSRDFTTAGNFSNQGNLTIGAGSTFTVTGNLTNAAGASTTLTVGTCVVAGTFSNQNSLTVGAGSTFTVTGSLANFAGTTLTGGSYVVGGTLKFPSADIRTNAASLVLDGPASQIVNQANVDALTNFAATVATNSFTVRNGRAFTTAGNFSNQGNLTIGTGSTFTVTGNLTNAAGAGITVTVATGVVAGAFNNQGSLTVGAGSTFTVTGSLTNFAGTTLTGGSYVVGGTFKFPGADIRTNAATLVLDGPTSQIVNQADADALTNLAATAATNSFFPNSFTVRNGRAFTTAGAFSNAGNLTVVSGSTFTVTGNLTNAAGAGITVTVATGVVAGAFSNQGSLTVGAGSTFTVTGSLTNFVGTTLTGGSYDIRGTFKFPGADIRTLAATLELDGPTSRVVNLADVNGLANLAATAATNSLTLSNGRAFTTAGPFSNAGSLTVGAGSTFTVTGRYTQQTAGSTTTLNGGTLVARSAAGTETVDIQAGTLAGWGTINAHLVNGGEVSPGGTNATGLLRVNGNYTQTGAGTLNIELGGRHAGQYDQLSISGVATLGGTLNILRIHSFLPSIDNRFQVLLFGSRDGTTRFVPNGQNVGPDRILELIYATDGLTLETRSRP